MEYPAIEMPVMILIADGFFLEKKYLRAMNADTFTLGYLKIRRWDFQN